MASWRTKGSSVLTKQVRTFLGSRQRFHRRTGDTAKGPASKRQMTPIPFHALQHLRHLSVIRAERIKVRHQLLETAACVLSCREVGKLDVTRKSLKRGEDSNVARETVPESFYFAESRAERATDVVPEKKLKHSRPVLSSDTKVPALEGPLVCAMSVLRCDGLCGGKRMMLYSVK